MNRRFVLLSSIVSFCIRKGVKVIKTKKGTYVPLSEVFFIDSFALGSEAKYYDTEGEYVGLKLYRGRDPKDGLLLEHETFVIQYEGGSSYRTAVPAGSEMFLAHRAQFVGDTTSWGVRLPGFQGRLAEILAAKKASKLSSAIS